MPRAPRSKKPALLFQSIEIDNVVRDCARTIEEAIRREVALRLDEAVERALAERARAEARATPRMCPVPGCGEPAAGPRNHWRCRTHGKLPAGVNVTRLPPGPGPRARGVGPSLECRVGGCPVKSRGPRYDFFCGEHYKLPREERERHTAEWKARKDAAGAPRAIPEPSVLLRRGAEVRPVDQRPADDETSEQQSS